MTTYLTPNGSAGFDCAAQYRSKTKAERRHLLESGQWDRAIHEAGKRRALFGRRA